MALDPREHVRIFGKTWVEKQTEEVLRVGKRRWSRWELVAKLGVGNMGAVGIARKVLQELEVRNLRDLKQLNPRDLAALKGVGATTLFVVLSILKAEGVDVLAWYGEGRTFATLKEQQKKAAAEEADGSASAAALSIDQ